MSTVRLDNRGLQPPEPMLRMLAACEKLEEGDDIEALMDRRPMFLFPELDDLGFRYVCVEGDAGGFVLIVERKS